MNYRSLAEAVEAITSLLPQDPPARVCASDKLSCDEPDMTGEPVPGPTTIRFKCSCDLSMQRCTQVCREAIHGGAIVHLQLCVPEPHGWRCHGREVDRLFSDPFKSRPLQVN